MERKVFTELKGQADGLNDALSRIGFRRSQTVAYRPSCVGCSACVSVRVVADEFRPSSTQKRNFRRNADLVSAECQPWATGEQFDLLRKYLGARHPGGGMAQMDDTDFADMVEHTPVTSFVIEYREPGNGITPGRLVGACLTDRQGDGLSMIYSFYDPDHEVRSGLGNYIILDHIRRAAAIGLPYVYLGYWVEGSERMQYKIRYRPLERLGADGWDRLSDSDHDALIQAVAASRRDTAGLAGAPAKDGLALCEAAADSDGNGAVASAGLAGSGILDPEFAAG
jgi:arginine-tRNA-protein transferase